jgi:hypothetical protein
LQSKGLTALLILCLALLVGCGGGGEGGSSSTGASEASSASGASDPASSSSDARQLPEEVQKKAAEGQERALEERRRAEAEQKHGQDQSAQPPQVQHNDAGGGSAQFRRKGGDNSIPEYGEEAPASERQEAADSLHAYMDSLAAHRWQAACTYMSASLLATIERLPEISKQQSDLEGKGCAEILTAVTTQTPQADLDAAAKADVASLRVEGDRAFLLYRGAGGENYVMPMVREEGAWRVGSLGGTAGF